MARGRRPEPAGGVPVLVVVVLLALAAGGAFYFARSSDAQKPDPAKPVEAAAPSPGPSPGATRPVAPADEAALEKTAERIAKERLRAKLPPAALEGIDTNELLAALKAEALEELRLGGRAVAWGHAHGKPEPVQQRVFMRIVDAAHQAGDTKGFTDEVIAKVYADEERK